MNTCRNRYQCLLDLYVYTTLPLTCIKTIRFDWPYFTTEFKPYSSRRAAVQWGAVSLELAQRGAQTFGVRGEQTVGTWHLYLPLQSDLQLDFLSRHKLGTSSRDWQRHYRGPGLLAPDFYATHMASVGGSTARTWRATAPGHTSGSRRVIVLYIRGCRIHSFREQSVHRPHMAGGRSRTWRLRTSAWARTWRA
jgi:hypothetical protein